AFDLLGERYPGAFTLINTLNVDFLSRTQDTLDAFTACLDKCLAPRGVFIGDYMSPSFLLRVFRHQAGERERHRRRQREKERGENEGEKECVRPSVEAQLPRPLRQMLATHPETGEVLPVEIYPRWRCERSKLHCRSQCSKVEVPEISLLPPRALPGLPPQAHAPSDAPNAPNAPNVPEAPDVAMKPSTDTPVATSTPATVSSDGPNAPNAPMVDVLTPRFTIHIGAKRTTFTGHMTSAEILDMSLKKHKGLVQIINSPNREYWAERSGTIINAHSRADNCPPFQYAQQIAKLDKDAHCCGDIFTTLVIVKDSQG
ncbi:hypothetical protein KIPB_010045, partial [Kipferlia bialata]